MSEPREAAQAARLGLRPGAHWSPRAVRVPGGHWTLGLSAQLPVSRGFRRRSCPFCPHPTSQRSLPATLCGAACLLRREWPWAACEHLPLGQ